MSSDIYICTLVDADGVQQGRMTSTRREWIELKASQNNGWQVIDGTAPSSDHTWNGQQWVGGE